MTASDVEICSQNPTRLPSKELVDGVAAGRQRRDVEGVTSPEANRLSAGNHTSCALSAWNTRSGVDWAMKKVCRPRSPTEASPAPTGTKLGDRPPRPGRSSHEVGHNGFVSYTGEALARVPASRHQSEIASAPSGRDARAPSGVRAA